MTLARLTLAVCLAAPFLAPRCPAAQDSSQNSPDPQTGSEAAKAKAKAEAAKKLEARRAEIRERIQRERARRRDQEVVRTHVKVRVKLRNGERLQGIVKNGRFVERPSGGLEFSRAEMTMKDAGLRLWYYNNTDGYMFLPYKWIKTYKVLKRLTDVEINVIRDEIKEKERVAKAESTKRLQEINDRQAARENNGKATEKLDQLAKSFAEKKARDAEQARLLALVDEFPPKEGWGEERINQINIRRLTIKVFPNVKERRFIEVFEDWKKGRDLWVAKQEEAKGGKGASGKAEKTAKSEGDATGKSAKKSGSSREAKPQK